MKTKVYTLTVVLVSMLAIAGCKKDSKEDTVANYLKVGTTDYEMTKGIIINSGPDNSVYLMSVYLFSSGLTIHEVDGFPDSISGIGNMIAFDVYTSGSDKITPGTYIYNSSELSGTFSDELYSVNYNPLTNIGDDFTDVQSGTLKVIQSGTEYEISFSGTDVNGKAVSGYYKGSLKTYTDFK